MATQRPSRRVAKDGSVPAKEVNQGSSDDSSRVSGFLRTCTSRLGTLDGRSLLLFRCALALVVTWDSYEKAMYAEAFYENTRSTFPRFALEEDVGWLASRVNPFCWFDGVLWPQCLFLLRALSAMGMPFSRASSLSCWALTTWATLRNVDMTFIFDRYLHVVLCFSCSLPFGHDTVGPCVSVTLLRLQLVWIYLDAGWGKVFDYSGDWTLHAKVPALAVYMSGAPGMSRLLALDRDLCQGMIARLGTPVVAWLELLVGPAMLLSSATNPGDRVVPEILCMTTVWLLHIGIALGMEGGATIASVAVASWFVILPAAFWNTLLSADKAKAASRRSSTSRTSWAWLSSAFIMACAAFLWSGARTSPGPFPTMLLYNRWVVFPFADTKVSWTVVPAMMADGAKVDLWSWKEISFERPRYGRRGRWMAFPANKPASEEALNARFDYLCKEWNAAHAVPVTKFQYFEINAELGVDQSLSKAKKFLVRSHACDEPGN